MILKKSDPLALALPSGFHNTFFLNKPIHASRNQDLYIHFNKHIGSFSIEGSQSLPQLNLPAMLTHLDTKIAIPNTTLLDNPERLEILDMDIDGVSYRWFLVCSKGYLSLLKYDGLNYDIVYKLRIHHKLLSMRLLQFQKPSESYPTLYFVYSSFKDTFIFKTNVLAHSDTGKDKTVLLHRLDIMSNTISSSVDGDLIILASFDFRVFIFSLIGQHYSTFQNDYFSSFVPFHDTIVCIEPNRDATYIALGFWNGSIQVLYNPKRKLNFNGKGEFTPSDAYHNHLKWEVLDFIPILPSQSISTHYILWSPNQRYLFSSSLVYIDTSEVAEVKNKLRPKIERRPCFLDVYTGKVLPIKKMKDMCFTTELQHVSLSEFIKGITCDTTKNRIYCLTNQLKIREIKWPIVTRIGSGFKISMNHVPLYHRSIIEVDIDNEGVKDIVDHLDPMRITITLYAHNEEEELLKVVKTFNAVVSFQIMDPIENLRMALSMSHLTVYKEKTKTVYLYYHEGLLEEDHTDFQRDNLSVLDDKSFQSIGPTLDEVEPSKRLWKVIILKDYAHAISCGYNHVLILSGNSDSKTCQVDILFVEDKIKKVYSETVETTVSPGFTLRHVWLNPYRTQSNQYYVRIYTDMNHAYIIQWIQFLDPHAENFVKEVYSIPVEYSPLFYCHPYLVFFCSKKENYILMCFHNDDLIFSTLEKLDITLQTPV